MALFTVTVLTRYPTCAEVSIGEKSFWIMASRQAYKRHYDPLSAGSTFQAEVPEDRLSLGITGELADKCTAYPPNGISIERNNGQLVIYKLFRSEEAVIDALR